MEGAGATASLSPVPIRIATPLAPSFLCVGVVGGDPPKSFAGFRHYLIPRHKSPARECRRAAASPNYRVTISLVKTFR